MTQALYDDKGTQNPTQTRSQECFDHTKARADSADTSAPAIDHTRSAESSEHARDLKKTEDEEVAADINTGRNMITISLALAATQLPAQNGADCGTGITCYPCMPDGADLSAFSCGEPSQQHLEVRRIVISLPNNLPCTATC